VTAAEEAGQYKAGVHGAWRSLPWSRAAAMEDLDVDDGQVVQVSGGLDRQPGQHQLLSELMRRSDMQSSSPPSKDIHPD